jgi:glycosyltransferase involved in cell wall biosynthesis
MDDSNLRVMYISNSVTLGGMETHLVDLARAVAARGNRVMAIVPAILELQSQVARLRAANIRVEQLNLAGAQSPTRLARAWMRLRALTREFKPDVAHQQRTGPYHGKWAVLAARLGGARAIVATEHQPAYRLRGAQRWLNRAADALVDAIIVVSEQDRKMQLELTDRPARKIFAIHNGIDISKFTPPTPDEIAIARRELKLPNNTRIIGTLARLDPQKGMPYLLRALAQVPGDWRAVIAGDGALRDELEYLSDQLGLTQRVSFLGFCDQPARVLAALDVFVLPSEWESFGLAPIEAMATGLPVVITRVGGMSELLIDGESGAFVAPRDVNALARALTRVLNDADLRARWGRAGRARVEKFFSVDAMTETTIAVYREVLRERK